MNNEDKALLSGSKMEKAKRVKGIRDIVEPQAYDAILRSLLHPDEKGDIIRAIDGLSQEDDFALMCRMMKTATHIVRLDQTPLVRNNTIAPDFLMCFQPGYYLGGLASKSFSPFRAFVEVKSTTGESFKISGSQLTKRRAFAQVFGFPLLFAVRFLNIPTLSGWVIIDGSDETQTTLKVSYADSAIAGYKNVLWDDFIYMPHPDLILERVFSQDAPACGSSHTDYGNLVEVNLHIGARTITYRVPEAIPAVAFLRCFGLQPTGIRQQETLFIETLRPSLVGCFLSDALYKFNKLITDEKTGQFMYNAPRIIAHVDQEDDSFFDRTSVHAVALDMLNKEVLYLLAAENDSDHIAKWECLGGKVAHS